MPLRHSWRLSVSITTSPNRALTGFAFPDKSEDYLRTPTAAGAILRVTHVQTLAPEEVAMKSRHVVDSRKWSLQVFVTFAACAVVTVLRASSDSSTTMPADVDAVGNWNVIALQAAQTAGQGAIVQSRTLAIVQVAVHDAASSGTP